jgi:hypothetical protein
LIPGGRSRFKMKKWLLMLSRTHVFVRYTAFISVLTNDDSSCIRSNIIENTISSNPLSLINCYTHTGNCHNLRSTLVKLIHSSLHSTVDHNGVRSRGPGPRKNSDSFFFCRLAMNGMCSHFTSIHLQDYRIKMQIGIMMMLMILSRI